MKLFRRRENIVSHLPAVLINHWRRVQAAMREMSVEMHAQLGGSLIASHL